MPRWRVLCHVICYVINISLEEDQVIPEVNQQFFMGTALPETSGARDDSPGLLKHVTLWPPVHRVAQLPLCRSNDCDVMRKNFGVPIDEVEDANFVNILRLSIVSNLQVKQRSLNFGLNFPSCPQVFAFEIWCISLVFRNSKVSRIHWKTFHIRCGLFLKVKVIRSLFHSFFYIFSLFYLIWEK